MYLRVTSSPQEIPENSPFNDDDVEAIRFMDSRHRSVVDMLRETCYELAQYQTRCEELEKRLARFESVEDFDPKPYIHAEVEA